MTSTSQRRLATLALASSVAACVAAVGCSLGLDRSLLSSDAGGDTSVDGPPPGEGGLPPDAPFDGPEGSMSGEAGDAPSEGAAGADSGTCNHDSDCKGLVGGCVQSATCDTTAHQCVPVVCPASACEVSTCGKAGKCSSAAKVSFQGGGVHVTAGGVASAAPRHSIAAAWPFVFVATTNGVVAYDVFDPTSASPAAVALHGVPFVAAEAVAVGRTVYFVSAVQGVAPGYRQAVAWLTVPENPLLTDLYASAAWVGTTASPLASVLPNGSGIFLVYGSSALLPTTSVTAPVKDGAMFSPFPNTGLAAGATTLVASGSRLVTYRYDAVAFEPYFGLVKGAGTASAAAGAEVEITSLGETDNQRAFGAGDDGSVVWETAPLLLDDAGVDQGVDSATLAWLLSSATDNGPAATAAVPLVTYSPPATGAVLGRPAWIDSNTALGLAIPTGTATTSTLVQVVTKKPAALVAGRSATLPVAPGLVDVAVSNGFAYALLQDDAMNLTCTVQILATGCAAAKVVDAGGD